MQEKMDTLDIGIRTMQDKIDTLDSGIRTELVSVNQKKTTMEVTMNQRVDVVEKDIEELKVQVREGLSKAPVSNTGSMLPEVLVKINTGSMLPEGLVKMKPPVFDGSVSWSVYRRQFEAAAKVNKWGSEEEKATALVLALRGKASEVLQSIPNQQDYAVLVQAMELRYGDEHLQEVYRVQLKTRQQRVSETLQELKTDIERLAHLAYPTAAQEFFEVIVIDAFIDAVRDPELKKVIRVSGKRKASEALVYALSYEAAKNASINSHHGRRLEVQEEDLTQVLRRITEVLVEYKPSRSQGAHRATRVRCWNCGESGHIQRMCRRTPNQQEAIQHRSETGAWPGANGYQEN
ncbi:uncharacterized protein LOC129923598 [Biomphalaria glabrata]|uniref:Uncharacterized protein LOC129923598 n=1 Tax=Biomphalaria glabrata TaxID=6526 RepID=A0A9W2Z8G9_BIOGL|nr:uncharacterized protein LOC129923598 [Biomphalaria glabrata]